MTFQKLQSTLMMKRRGKLKKVEKRTCSILHVSPTITVISHSFSQDFRGIRCRYRGFTSKFVSEYFL